MATPNAITGRSVRSVAARTVDLVNLLAGGEADAAAVAAVLRAHGETDPVTGDDVARLRGAADRIRAVLALEEVGEAAAAINRLLADARPPRLTDHGGITHWHVHADGDDDAPLDEWFTASACVMLALLVTDRQRPPGGVCADPGCDQVFVDTGSGSRRRFCSRRCATRSRVAAHRRAGAARKSL